MTDEQTASRTGVDWSAVRVVLGRDLSAIARSKALILPMLFLPIVLLVLLLVAATGACLFALFDSARKLAGL